LTAYRGSDKVGAVNWQLLIADLQQRGLSQSQIASACNCGQATISELAKGKNDNPSFRLGQALIALQRRRRTRELKAA
jgi:transcriptional regulator with XRE-family HTH domain